MVRLLLVSVLASGVAACGGPELTKEMLEVRSVTDASACELIESTYLESRPQLIQDFVKRNVHNVGGDSYKIVNVSEEVVMGATIAKVSYEAYKCRR